MLINASINVYTWLTNFGDLDFQKANAEVSNVLLPLFQSLDIQCSASQFLHTISEQDEMEGIDRCGVSFQLSVQTRHPASGFRLLKLFESLAAVIDMLPEPIQKCEFVLTEA